jgi:hypothetical protein
MLFYNEPEGERAGIPLHREVMKLGARGKITLIP